MIEYLTLTQQLKQKSMKVTMASYFSTQCTDKQIKKNLNL